MLLVQLTAACSREPEVSQIAQTEQPAASVVAPAPAQAEDRKLIVAFGDSLMAGYGLSQSEGFAPVLERSLAGQGMKAQVVNAGVSGDTTAAGRQRLDFVLDGLARKPDLVIVGLGANDMLRGLDPGQARKNLDAILATLRDRKIDAVIAGVLSAPNMGKDYEKQFNAIYPNLARKYQLPLYPFFLDGIVGHPDRMLPDGLHPNKAGVELIVKRILPTVESAAKP